MTTFRPELVPIYPHVRRLGFLSILQKVLELVGCRADVIHHTFHHHLVLLTQPLNVLPCPQSWVNLLVCQGSKSPIA